jgi:hypothetical protein
MKKITCYKKKNENDVKKNNLFLKWGNKYENRAPLISKDNFQNLDDEFQVT